MVSGGARKRTVSARKKTSMSRESEEHEQYLIRIEAADADYMFGVNLARKQEKPYWEFCHPRVRGQIISPELKGANEAEITFIGDRALNRELVSNDSDFAPVAVGSIEVIDGKLIGTIAIPFSALSLLQPALVTGQVNLLVLNGKKLKYRKAKIKSVHFTSKHTVEDLA